MFQMQTQTGQFCRGGTTQFTSTYSAVRAWPDFSHHDGPATALTGFLFGIAGGSLCSQKKTCPSVLQDKSCLVLL